MANETIGKVPCAFCESTAPVRKNAKRKLYYVCGGCGIVQPNMPRFQEWILEHAKIDGPQIELQEEDYKIEKIEKDDLKVAAPIKAATPKPTPEKPKSRGFGLVRF